MKDLVGPFAHFHSLWPESTISAASVGGTCVGAVLFNNWDLLAVTGRVSTIFERSLMIFMTEMFFYGYETFLLVVL